jgi:zinc D-Ala-D-Ala dipeptidase
MLNYVFAIFFATFFALFFVGYVPAANALTVRICAQDSGVTKSPQTSIQPPAAELTMPNEEGHVRKADLVELVKLDPSIKLDVRYAKPNNFVGRPLYKQERAFLQRPAAEALVRAHKALQPYGYGLLIFDGYRPWRITKLFWEVTPAALKKFVANPRQGSRHNRGCAVDLSLYDLKTGKEVPMPSQYDEMTERAYPSYAGGTAEQNHARDLLKQEMEKQGFTVFSIEWWHFDYNGWRDYAILDIDFSEIK